MIMVALVTCDSRATCHKFVSKSLFLFKKQAPSLDGAAKMIKILVKTAVLITDLLHPQDAMYPQRNRLISSGIPGEILPVLYLFVPVPARGWHWCTLQN